MERGLIIVNFEFLVWSGVVKNNFRIDVRNCGWKFYLIKKVFDLLIFW